jgi:hypothetical protein
MCKKYNYELYQDEAWFREKLKNYFNKLKSDWIEKRKKEDPNYCVLWKPLNNLFTKNK